MTRTWVVVAETLDGEPVTEMPYDVEEHARDMAELMRASSMWDHCRVWVEVQGAELEDEEDEDMGSTAESNITDDDGTELRVEVRTDTAGLILSEPAWPHYQLESEEGRRRIQAIAGALGFNLAFGGHRLGLPEDATWCFVGPMRWALVHRGRIALEVEV